ncbi:hypothetical protein SAMN05444521_0174 [Streptomyces sp. 3214.6]|nr:hypothetical protein SAMN05444521_0174 [Streptomyces sp. 3214.6]
MITTPLTPEQRTAYRTVAVFDTCVREHGGGPVLKVAS